MAEQQQMVDTTNGSTRKTANGSTTRKLLEDRKDLRDS
jgi:hypothetical protein